MRENQRLRRSGWQIAFYVIVTYVVTSLAGKYLFCAPATAKVIQVLRDWWPFILMWLPGLVSVFFRIVLRQGLRDVGWKLGRCRFWIWAIVVPLAIFTAGYLGAYLSKSTDVLPSALGSKPWQDAVELFEDLKPSLASGDSPALRILWIFIISGGAFMLAFSYALGEEIGWRGYLQLRLLENKWPYPLFLCGLIWALWHVFPFFIVGHLPLGAFRTSLWIMALTLIGVVIGWLRLASGSIWVATMMHAAHNMSGAVYHTAFDNGFSSDWVSEQGIFIVLAYSFVVLWLIVSGRTRYSKELFQRRELAA